MASTPRPASSAAEATEPGIPSDVRALQTCLRDVSSLLALPSVWVGRTPPEIAAGLPEVMLSMLRLDLAWVRSHEGAEFASIANAPTLKAGAVSASLRHEAPGSELDIPDPRGGKSLRVLVVALGIEGQSGVLAAGSARRDFPNDVDRFLLRAAANQAHIAIEAARLMRAKEESDASFRDLAETAHQGLHWVGPDGRILWANRAELEMLGYTREEYIGRHVADFHVDGPCIDDILARLGRHEVLREHPARLRCKDGSIRDVRIDSSVLVRDGKFVHTRCFTRDVTETKAAEARLAALVRAGAILGSALDYESTLRNVMEAALPVLGDFGFFDVVEGDSVRRIARAHEDPALESALSQSRWEKSTRTDVNLCALSTGRSAIHPQIGEEWLRDVATSPGHHAAMKQLGFHSMLTVPLDLQGRILGSLTLFFSRSERRHSDADREFAEEIARRAAVAVENARLYQQQAEATRRKDEFLAMLGHELRNPLAPILTAVQLMDMRNDAGQRERSVIRRQAEHLTRLVDDLLDISRVTRGKIELRKERLDVHTSIAKSIEIASPLLEQRAHRLTIDVPRDELHVEADPVRLSQIVANLLTNAARYTPPNGNIHVKAAREDDHVAVSVTDDGIGIAPELIPRIFEMFVQGDREIDRSEGGLGLGLALVQSLTKLHDGSVTVLSDGLGTGSTFVVRLPLSKAVAGSRAKGRETRSRTGAARRILVVEDIPDVAEMLASALRTLGHDVRVVHDGPAALRAVETVEPEVAILDIGLPVMDGYELAKRLRASGRPLRLIAVSGYGQEEDRARAAEAGFDVHLLKPVDLRLLEETLAAKTA